MRVRLTAPQVDDRTIAAISLSAAAELSAELDRLRRRAARERAARKQAEALIESKSRSLYLLNCELVKARDALETIVLERTAELLEANRQLLASKAQADAANLAKSEFLANMSHEIRTPLTSILGYLDLLHDESDDGLSPEQRRDMLAITRQAGQHLLAILNDILDLSKIESGQMQVECVETDIQQLVVELDSLLRPRAARKGLKFELRLGNPIPQWIYSDPTRLRQVLLNLTGNALKFTEEGEVSVAATTVCNDAGTWLEIDVQDTGRGLTSDQAASIFRPFTQADASTTRKFGGTGLGLNLSRRLAGLLGGNVTLVKSWPERGSVFRLVVPCCPVAGTLWLVNLAERRCHPPAGPQNIPRLTGRILLAEDGPDNQRLFRLFLTKAGAAVDVADNGQIALAMIERAVAAGHPYDLLVSDMQMPELDGYSLARTLRRYGSKLPIIALTAHAMSGDRAQCKAAGCNDYASKPIDCSALVNLCAGWLTASSPPKSG